MKKVPKRNKNKTKPRQRLALPTLASFIFLALVSLVSITLASYQIAYLGKIYPGIKVAGVHLGNKTPSEARGILETKLATYKKSGLDLSLKDEVKNYSLENLEVDYNLESAVNHAYQIGRSPNLITSLSQRIKAWNNKYNLSPELFINETKLRDTLTYFGNKISKKPREAKIHFTGNQVQIDPSEKGEELDILNARTEITDHLATFSVSPIMLKIKTVNPAVSQDEVEKYRQNLERLLSKPIKLTFGSKSWELGGENLANLITFKKTSRQDFLNFEVGETNYRIEKVTVATAENEGSLKTLSLDQELLNTFVTKISKEIDQEPQNAKFTFSDGRVTLFTPSRDGQKLDSTVTINKINELFGAEQNASNNTNTITLPVTVTKATVTTDSVNNLGIRELIGQGVSTFLHSIPNRASNIGLAASRVNGTLVAPGQIFSMYKTIGEVEGSTGYKEAYIISQGRTQLDFGGGVCQVSTTLFRAALNSGLPILERHPHAYRVGYYEQNSPAGIDASVFFPNSDFQFRNDTQNYILIQTVFNSAASSLVFNFYGTRDGRQVSITKPTLSNQTPPPPDLHQDDPTLLVGVVKQVDFSAWGATTSFSRTVTKDGQTLSRDTFNSRYQPWRAIFLHGTKVS